MYTLQEVEKDLDKGSLSDALYKMERFAYANSLVELATWCSHELQGYFGSSKEEKEANHGYRTIAVQWLDVRQRPIVISPELSFISSMPLREGVSELEGFEQKGMLMHYPDLVETLQPFSNVPVAGAYMPPEQLQALLKRIRLEARRRLHDSAPRVPGADGMNIHEARGQGFVRKHLKPLRIVALLLTLATIGMGVAWYLNPQGNYEPAIFVLGSLAALIGVPSLSETFQRE